MMAMVRVVAMLLVKFMRPNRPRLGFRSGHEQAASKGQQQDGEKFIHGTFF